MTFYEENAETKISATRKILILTLDMKNIEYLINHGKYKNLKILLWELFAEL
jgi:hypothetical protein